MPDRNNTDPPCGASCPCLSPQKDPPNHSVERILFQNHAPLLIPLRRRFGLLLFKFRHLDIGLSAVNDNTFTKSNGYFNIDFFVFLIRETI